VLFHDSIIKLFDRLSYSATGANLISDNQEDMDWLLTTCFKALHGVVSLYSKYTDQLGFLLQHIFQLLVSCLLSENETLATFGMTAFGTLLFINFLTQFDTCNTVCTTFYK